MRASDVPWLRRLHRFWSQRMDALATELSRGRRERRRPPEDPDGSPDDEEGP